MSKVATYEKLVIYRPVKTNLITQKFGRDNTAPSMLPLYNSMGMLGHNGIDMATYEGERLYFPCNVKGLVIGIHTDRYGGIGIDILTETVEGLMKHRFWHLRSLSEIYVKVGDIVETGDLIAITNNTGKSTGNHVHYGMKPQIEKEGKFSNAFQTNGYFGAIDQEKYIRNIYVVDYMEILNGQATVLKKMIYLIKLFLTQ